MAALPSSVPLALSLSRALGTVTRHAVTRYAHARCRTHPGAPQAVQNMLAAASIQQQQAGLPPGLAAGQQQHGGGGGGLGGGGGGRMMTVGSAAANGYPPTGAHGPMGRADGCGGHFVGHLVHGQSQPSPQPQPPQLQQPMGIHGGAAVAGALQQVRGGQMLAQPQPLPHHLSLEAQQQQQQTALHSQLQHARALGQLQNPHGAAPAGGSHHGAHAGCGAMAATQTLQIVQIEQIGAQGLPHVHVGMLGGQRVLAQPMAAQRYDLHLAHSHAQQQQQHMHAQHLHGMLPQIVHVAAPARGEQQQQQQMQAQQQGQPQQMSLPRLMQQAPQQNGMWSPAEQQ
jgi:hypothetical protein